MKNKGNIEQTDLSRLFEDMQSIVSWWLTFLWLPFYIKKKSVSGLSYLKKNSLNITGKRFGTDFSKFLLWISLFLLQFILFLGILDVSPIKWRDLK